MKRLTLALVVAAVLAILAIVGLVIAIRSDTDKKVSNAEIEDQWAQYDYAVQACDRGNELRIDLNSMIAAVQGVNQLLVEFFDSSAAFRTAEGRARLAEESIEARDTIKEFADSAVALPLTNCNLVWPLPPHPRPPADE